MSLNGLIGCSSKTKILGTFHSRGLLIRCFKTSDSKLQIPQFWFRRICEHSEARLLQLAANGVHCDSVAAISISNLLSNCQSRGLFSILFSRELRRTSFQVILNYPQLSSAWMQNLAEFRITETSLCKFSSMHFLLSFSFNLLHSFQRLFSRSSRRSFSAFILPFIWLLGPRILALHKADFGTRNLLVRRRFSLASR